MWNMILKRIVFINGCLILFSYCNHSVSNLESQSQKINKYWDSIQHSQDHYDYINFLNDFPDSKYFDIAITRYIDFKRKYEDTIKRPAWDCFRNCVKVEVDSIGNVLFENDSLEFVNLRAAVLKQLLNPRNEEDLPEQVEIVDSKGVKRTVSKGMIYVITRFKLPSNLKKVVVELKKAIEDYKRCLSVEWYDEPIYKLNESELRNIESAIRTKYYFDKFDFYPVSINEYLEEPNEID